MTDYSRTGGEFTLNTQTVGNQTTPTVAGFAGGGFVAVWTTADAAQDGSGTAIKFQLYDAAGAAVGSETLVNTAGSLNQVRPSVATLASGNFLVTWETSDTTQDGAGTAIKAQLFSGAGVAIGGEFRVNTQGAADQTVPVVTGLADGGFVVAWQTADATQDGHSSAIKGQRYDASGSAVGGEFLINPPAVGPETDPHLTALAGGGFLASWTAGSGTNADIYAQVFDAAGAKVGAAFRVNTTTAFNQNNVSATQLADGRIVMTWGSWNSLTSSDYDIKAQVFSASGTRIGSEFTVNTTHVDPDFATLVGPSYPEVDDLPDGGFVITWTQWSLDSGFRAQFYDASAQRVGGEVVVNTTGDRTELYGDVAVDGLGRVFAVWGSGAMTSPFDQNIRGQFFTSAPGVAITSNGGGDAAAVSVVENTSAVTTVSASGGAGVVYAIAAGFDASRFTINAATGALAFISPRDYEIRNDSNGNNIYRVVVTATSGTLVDVQELTVTVTNVDEAPVFAGSTSAYTYYENGTAAVATVQASDPEGATVTYSLTGADAAHFTIGAGGVLAFAAAPDYEAAADAGGNHIYDVTVVASDGTFAVSRALTVELRNQNEGPVITSNGGGATAALTVAENVQVVTVVTAVDPDQFPSSYTITLSGADAALFNIQAQTGQLYFRSARNFEAAPADANGDGVYEVTVSVTDGFTPPDTQALSITVTDVDERPTITSASGFARSEGQLAVATIVAADPEGAAVSYAITGGADAARFTLDPVTGALAFVTAPNFEAPGDADGNNSYIVVVSASDGSLSQSQTVSVVITNVNEGPAFASPAALSASENATAVATVAASDPEGGAVAYTIAGGADAALFSIDAGTGALRFLAAPDHEAPADADGDNVYQVVVSASDSTTATSQALSVTVGNANDNAPVITAFSSDTIVSAMGENSTAWLDLGATDADGDAVTFSLAGLDAANVTIDAATGLVQFVTAPDYEAPGSAQGSNSYVFDVIASDGVNSDVLHVTLHVFDIDEALAITSAGGAVTVAENATVVTTVTAIDPEGEAPAYAIAGGADAALFVIDGATGALRFAAAPDFETPADADGDNVYDVIVSASDGTFTDTQAIAVTVEDVAEVTLAFAQTAFAEWENFVDGATLAVTGGNASDPFSYTITGGADAALFGVSDGVLALAPQDFEAPADSDGDNAYEVEVTAEQGGHTVTAALVVTVDDLDEAPVFTSPAEWSSDENGEYVGTLAAADPEGRGMTYFIAGGADAALFLVIAATGEFGFLDASDFELPADADGDGVYELRVGVADDGNIVTATIRVTVGDVAESLAFTATAFAADENQLVAAALAVAPGSPAATYAISGGADAALFALDATTGELTFVAAPDFDAWADADGDNVFEVEITASAGTSSGTETIRVTLGDVDEAPAIVSPARFAATENQVAAGTVVASDPEIAPLAYSIVGGADAARLVIDQATGALAFVQAPNFEAPADADHDNVYQVVVAVSDGTHAVTQAVSVTVANANEAPVIVSGGGGSAAVYTVNENATAVATIAATDPEGGINYVIVGGADAARFVLDPGTGALRFLAAPDYDAPADVGGDNRYEVIVAATDGQLSDTQAIKVVIENIPGLTLNGTSAANTLNGSGEDDTIRGLAGNDTLSGLAAADTLDGGDGQDRLIGGAGGDQLTGGLKADDFIYTALSESTLAASDRILDFSHSQNDDIDLAQLDANALVAGNQAFAFIGSAAFAGSAGQLRAFQQAGDTFVQGDVDGDGLADFQIVLDQAMTLVAADFVL